MIVYIVFLSSIFLLSFLDKFPIKSKQSYIAKIDNCGLKLTNREVNINKRKFSFAFKTAAIIVFIFTAFRYDIGWDYMAYYNTIRYNAITNIISNNEYATIWLIDISKNLGIPNLYFVVNTFICLFFILTTVKKYSKDVWLSLIFFLSFPLFYLNSLSVIRLFSALAISFYGFKYIEKKNFIHYLITIVIASLFHRSALIALAFYFLKDIKLKTNKLIFILALLPIFSNLINIAVVKFLPRYSVYTKATTVQEGTKAILVFIFIGVISLLFREKIIKNDPNANIYYNLFYVGLCIYLMFFKQGTMGHRLGLYGTIYSLLLIPKILSLFGNKKEKTLIKFLVYLFCIVSFVFTVYVGADTYIPYKMIWNQH
ncbi:EpsG family protein [Anaerocolumna aminovalerica]|uniref:EpsG family protein n=1 Tax=Anaerocolumna aminovalerica TaxID=1527 RepID=UPI000BE2684D|nr:EpsG family protein [Anaerocolumna aminovalerica]